MNNKFLKNASIAVIIILVILVSILLAVIFMRSRNLVKSQSNLSENLTSISDQLNQNSSNINKVLEVENPNQLISQDNLNQTLNTVISGPKADQEVIPTTVATIFDFKQLQNTKIDTQKLNLSQVMVENINDNFKIIQIPVNRDLPEIFKALVVPSPAPQQRLNYVFVLQNDDLRYFGDSVEYVKKVIIENKAYLFIEKYESDSSYPKFYLIDLVSNNQINVEIPIEVPLNIYPSEKNQNFIYIEAYNTNGIGAIIEIYEIDLAKLLNRDLDPIIGKQKK